MRYLILPALIACSSTSTQTAHKADTIAVYDTLLEKELFTVPLDSPLDRKIDGDCILRARDGHPVVRCLDVAIRFDCADHPAGHPLGMFVGSVGYDITCR